MIETPFVVGLEGRACRRYVVARVWLVSLLVVASIAAAVTAHAEPSQAVLDQAADAFSVGKDAFNDEDYKSAAAHFLRADGLAPNPLVLELAIRSYVEAGETTQAATLARLGQALYPDDERFSSRESLLVDAAEVAGRVVVQCPAPCALVLDGAPVHGPPLRKRVLYVGPGSYELRAEWDGDNPATRTFKVRAGKRARVVFRDSAGAVDEPDPSESAGSDTDTEAGEWEDETSQASSDALVPNEDTTEAGGLSPVWFWTGVGVSTALVGTSIWSAVDAQKNPGEDAVRRDCAPGDRQCPTYLEGVENQRRTNVLWGVTAGAAVVTGLVAIFTDFNGDTDSSDGRTDSARLSPVLRFGDGFMLGAQGAF